jgi:hypothetical protein
MLCTSQEAVSLRPAMAASFAGDMQLSLAASFAHWYIRHQMLS